MTESVGLHELRNGSEQMAANSFVFVQPTDHDVFDFSVIRILLNFDHHRVGNSNFAVLLKIET